MNKYAMVMAAAFLTAAPAFGHDGPPMDQGSWELRLSSDTVNDFVPQISYFISDHLAAVLNVAYDNNETDRGGTPEETTEMSIGFGLELNLGMADSRVVPFIGGSIAYINDEETGGVADVSASGAAFGIEGGLKFMVGERSSVNVSALYSTGTFDTETGGVSTGDVDLTRFAARLGYSLYF